MQTKVVENLKGKQTQISEVCFSEQIILIPSIDWDSQSAMYHMESDSDSEQQKKSKYGLDEYINSTPPKVQASRNYRRQFFACQKSPDQLKLEENKNAHITDKLAILERNCESRGDKWRSFAYAKAGRLLKNAKFKVTTVEEAKRLPGIGSRIAEKVRYFGSICLNTPDRRNSCDRNVEEDRSRKQRRTAHNTQFILEGIRNLFRLIQFGRSLEQALKPYISGTLRAVVPSKTCM